MGQRLILPYRRAMIIAGYKTEIYRREWGFNHYGIDISSVQGVNQKDHTIRASGDGQVVWCKKDEPKAGRSLGWAVAIRYNGCIGRDGGVSDLIARYMHSPLVYVKQGDYVHLDDPIAVEGMEGTGSYHLHFELDTDCKYPQYSPQVATGHTGWKKGTDTTLNPSLWLWVDAGHVQEPYNFGNRNWINTVDSNLPIAPTEKTETERLREQLAAAQHEIAELNALIRNKDAIIARMRDLAAQMAKL